MRDELRNLQAADKRLVTTGRKLRGSPETRTQRHKTNDL